MTQRHVPVGVEKDLIYDVGMHRGEDTAFYLSRGYRVVGIEANARLVELLHERFGPEERDGRVVILPVAVGPAAGTARLAVSRDETQYSTTDPKFIARGQRRDVGFDMVEVEMTTLDDVMGRYGTPYFLKVDIEGLDTAAVERLVDLDVRPPMVSIESRTAGPKATVGGVLSDVRLLRRLGYRRFKLVNQGRISKLDGTVLDREGETVVYSHAAHSSGPFGDEAPGPWRRAGSIVPIMLGRLAYFHLLGEAGWFPSTRLGRSMREGAMSWQRNHAPELHAGRYLGGSGWYDLHAVM
jgi:FkbM family methyltransferase